MTNPVHTDAMRTVAVKFRGEMAGFHKSAATFFRVSMIGTTFLAPALGILSASNTIRLRVVVATFLVAMAIHIAMYVLNDIVDLEIDRTAPRRALSPLVRGAISRRAAGVIVAVAVVSAFSLDRLLLGYEIWRESALALVFAALTVYNLYGKKFHFPPLTDLIQGIGCGMAVLYGTLASGGINLLSWAEAVFMAVYIAMANGIHGSLRDVENDHAHGVRSTAILLGVRTDDRGLLLPVRLRAYGLALQAALGICAALALAESARRTHHVSLGLYLGVICILFSFVLLVRAFSYARSFSRLILAGAAHLVVAILPALAAAANGHGFAVECVVIAFTIGPLFVSPRYRGAFLWLAGIEPSPEHLKAYERT